MSSKVSLAVYIMCAFLICSVRAIRPAHLILRDQLKFQFIVSTPLVNWFTAIRLGQSEGRFTVRYAKADFLLLNSRAGKKMTAGSNSGLRQASGSTQPLMLGILSPRLTAAGANSPRCSTCSLHIASCQQRALMCV